MNVNERLEQIRQLLETYHGELIEYKEQRRIYNERIDVAVAERDYLDQKIQDTRVTITDLEQARDDMLREASV